jgi:hypothetical protein
MKNISQEAILALEVPYVESIEQQRLIGRELQALREVEARLTALDYAVAGARAAVLDALLADGATD